MENIRQKKKPCEKWLRKIHLKNVVITYKSQILKFFTKKMRLNVPNFLYIYKMTF